MIGDGRNSQPGQTYEQDLEAVRTAWSKLEKTEPPALIDQSIRGAARRALAGRPRRRTLGWIGGLATAAVVVLALAIVLQQGPEGPAARVPETDGYEVEARSAAARQKLEEQEAYDAEILIPEPPQSRQDSSAAVASDAHGTAEEPRALQRETAPEGVATESPLPPAAAPSAEEPAVSSRAAAAADSGQPDALEAEVWIERLLQLQRAGRLAELNEELVAFRKAYPGHPLPPQLNE